MKLTSPTQAFSTTANRYMRLRPAGTVPFIFAHNPNFWELVSNTKQASGFSLTIYDTDAQREQLRFGPRSGAVNSRLIDTLGLLYIVHSSLTPVSIDQLYTTISSLPPTAIARQSIRSIADVFVQAELLRSELGLDGEPLYTWRAPQGRFGYELRKE